MTVDEFKNSGLREVVTAVKEKLKGLEKRDIFILELSESGKKPICKAIEI